MANLELGTTLYGQIAQDFRKQIKAGTLKAGDKIPSTADLMARYGVSNNVVRAAITELKSEGLLRGHAGKGVYVQDERTVRAEVVGVLNEALDELAALAEREGSMAEQLSPTIERLGFALAKLQGER
ncbi:MAG TPA: winged helix-turn-helix domain-containing protein [Actinospica sp.]|nr:winged helix-turn-helix domain-containing protein [Actinospica sp.]